MKKNFTKKKFLQLEFEAKHKKLAKMLSLIYELTIQKKDTKEIVDHYLNIISWIDFKIDNSWDLKSISNRYHRHLKLAKMSLKEHNLLPFIRTNDRKEAKENFLSNAIFLDNIRSAYNVGNILRTTESLRIGNVYFNDKTPFIDNKKVIKTSMGAYDIVPCYRDVLLNDLPSPVIALDTSDDAINIFDFIFPEQFTLVLGNEEYGISDDILEKSDYILEVPMLGIKNSLNVASAYAIAASLIRRQRI